MTKRRRHRTVEIGISDVGIREALGAPELGAGLRLRVRGTAARAEDLRVSAAASPDAIAERACARGHVRTAVDAASRVSVGPAHDSPGAPTLRSTRETVSAAGTKPRGLRQLV